MTGNNQETDVLQVLISLDFANEIHIIISAFSDSLLQENYFSQQIGYVNNDHTCDSVMSMVRQGCSFFFIMQSRENPLIRN